MRLVAILLLGVAAACSSPAAEVAETADPTPTPAFDHDAAREACEAQGQRYARSSQECFGELPDPNRTPRPTAVPTPTPVPPTFDELLVEAETISYEDLFRNSGDHVGKLVYFRGQVIQVLGEPGGFEFRIAVTPGDYGFWDDPVYVLYEGTDRFLVDDIVDMVGVSTDVITYESTMGGEITIPSMFVTSTGLRLVE